VQSEPLIVTFANEPFLTHREFQPLPEAFDRVVVRHFLTPRGCGDKVRALRELGAFSS